MFVDCKPRCGDGYNCRPGRPDSDALCTGNRAPWVPGAPTVLIGNMPALDDQAKLMCMWAGVIQITVPGQLTTQVP